MVLCVMFLDFGKSRKVVCRMATEYMKATGSLLAGVAAVVAAYNVGDGHGLARDGLLGHMSAKDAGKQFGEEAAKSFEKIQQELCYFLNMTTK